MPAGSIIIDLLLRTGSFETDTKRASKALDGMSKSALAMGTAMGQFLHDGIAKVVSTLPDLVMSAVNAADQMRDLSIRVGESTELLSAYGYAASQTGTDIETLGKGLKVLSKNAADALNPTSEQAKVFKALGIQVTDASGKLKSLSTLVPEIADRFAVLEDGTTKAALAQALFGKAGLELTEFLNSGSAGLDEFTAKAKKLGIVIDSETAAKADTFNDTMGDLKRVSEGYALHLAQDLLPDLQKLASGFTDTATEGGKVEEMARDTADLLRGVASVISFVGNTFNVAGKSLAAFVALLVAAKKAATGDFSGAAALASEAVAGVAEATGAKYKHPPAAANTGLVFAGVDPDPTGLFKQSANEASLQKERDELAKRLALALSNPTAAGKARLTDEQREAQKLQDTYGALVDSLTEQIALYGQISEESKTRYRVEQGDLKDLTQAQKDNLLELARWQDWQDDMAALDEVRAQSAADANQKIIDSWTETMGAMSVYAEQAGRNIQDTFADFLYDPFEDGLDGMLKSFADTLRRMAAEMASSQLMKTLGQWGTNNADAGGWTGALAGFAKSFFGGGKAAGGTVTGSKLYEVTEGGNPELLRQGNRTYLMPGTDGRVIPATQGMAAPGGYGAPNVNIKVIGAPGEATATARSGPNGLDIEIMFKQIEGRIAGNIANGASPVLGALKARTGLKETV